MVELQLLRSSVLLGNWVKLTRIKIRTGKKDGRRKGERVIVKEKDSIRERVGGGENMK